MRAWIASCLLVGVTVAGCASGERAAPPINDARLIERIEAGAVELCESGHARTLVELAAQLGRERVDPPAVLPATHRGSRGWPDVYRRTADRVLVVARLEKCDKCPRWHHKSEATAFVVAHGGVCVTCRHLFEHESEGRLVAASRDGRVFPVVEVLAACQQDDLAIFRIDGADDLPPIPLRSDAAAGEEIGIISHPRHVRYMFTRGVVARVGERFSGLAGDMRSLRSVPTPILHVTADYGAGSSGAPVLDSAGNALGVVVMTTSVRPDHNDNDIQMVLRTCATAGRVRRLLGG